MALCPKCHEPLKRGQCTPCESRRKRIQRYGLTDTQYRALMVRSRGCCEACGDPLDPERLVIDHDHKGGWRAVRGLICYRCNTALGMVRDEVRRLQGLINYLLRTRGV